MKNKIFKTGGAELLQEEANRLRSYADDLDKAADAYEETRNPEYLSDGLNTIRNCFGNIRFDLFISRAERDKKLK
jgi:hypothetical protein